MNTINMIIAAYQFLSWWLIYLSTKNAKTDIELFGEELE